MNVTRQRNVVFASAMVFGMTGTVIAADNNSVHQHWSALPAPGAWLNQPFEGAPPLLTNSPQAPRPTRGLCDGFPVNLIAPGAGFPYTPTLFDADGDGAAEIFLTGGDTFGLRGDGTFLPGWPTQDHQYMGYGTNACKPGPSVADLEGDGDVEIMWTERDWWAGSSRMYTFNGREFDGSNLPNLPQYAPDDYSNALDTPFVLGDTDGDGILEAWGAHTLGNAFIHYRISAVSHEGMLLFTTDIDTAENMLSLYFGDVDGDGAEEIFGVSSISPDLYLHVFNSDGSERSGYPVLLDSLGSYTLPFGPPIPFDLDGDGDLEILFGVYSGTSYARCVHHTGDPCAGFPMAINSSSQLFYLGLGDLTGDGAPELLALDNHLGSNYRASAIDLATGSMLPGWPVAVPNWPHGFPGVADVDGDGLQDMVFSTDGGEVYALHSDGSVIAGYPLTMGTGCVSGLAIGDIDGDDLFEIVASTWDGFVYAWNTTGVAGPADWPLRGVDARNTGVYKSSVDCPEDLDGDGTIGQSDLGILLASYNQDAGGDIDGDGDTDQADLGALLSAYGQDCP